ncbi:MAG: hypothetical protein IPK28_11160 [Devosia sp.]|nr:hypothetical protein [Devosia sp.]
MAIKGLVARAQAADEVEWSGINEWLDLAGNGDEAGCRLYLNANGVRVEEDACAPQRPS